MAGGFGTSFNLSFGILMTIYLPVFIIVAFVNKENDNNNGNNTSYSCPIIKSNPPSTSPTWKVSRFMWGSATAAPQIEGGVNEGGKSDSIWDIFARTSGKVYKNETLEIADDSYHKYKQDIQLLKNMNLKYYRLSFAWPRIVPDGINPNMQGIKYYKNVHLC